VTALYATQYKRTRATAEPLASRLKLAIVERPVASGSADGYARELTQEILLKHRGGTVVAVGHSNTVPAIVEAMSGRRVGPITEAEYDHIFVVIVPHSGSARLFKARYGEAGAVVPSR
jgi:broad specificity phosphatase PhoE